MTILTEHKHAQSLSAYWNACRQSDFQHALGMVDSALSKNPDDPLLWWYRVYARDRLGLVTDWSAELQGFGPGRSPAATEVELVPRRAERPIESQTLFESTVNTASGALCATFLDLLNCNQSLALCRRLVQLAPASASAYTERLRLNLDGLLRELQPALSNCLVKFSVKPTRYLNLMRLIHLMQIYEDLLKADFLADGGDPARVGPVVGSRLATQVEERTAGFLDQGRSLSFFAQLAYRSLTLMLEALRAGWPLDFIGPKILKMASRPTGAEVLNYGRATPPVDYYVHLGALGHAINVLDKAFRPPPKVMELPSEQMMPADQTYFKRAARRAQAQGFRFLGYCAHEGANSQYNHTTVSAVFIADDPCMYLTVMRLHFEKGYWFWNCLIGLIELLGLTGSEGVEAVLSDGSCLLVMNCPLKLPYEPPPGVYYEKAPLRASLKKRAALLRQRLAERLKAEPTLGVQSLSSLAEIIEHEQRGLEMEIKHRRSLPQFVLDDELKRLVGRSRFPKQVGPIRELITHLTPLWQIRQTEDEPGRPVSSTGE